jgi:hypothetical protein
MGFFIEYEPCSSGYLIWFPGVRKLDKACHIIFHKDAVMPATSVLYSDETPILIKANVPVVLPAVQVPKLIMLESAKLTI